MAQSHQCAWRFGVAGPCTELVHSRKHQLARPIAELLQLPEGTRGVMCAQHSKVDVCVLNSPDCAQEAKCYFDTRRRHVMPQAYEWQLELLQMPVMLAQQADSVNGDPPRACFACTSYCAQNRGANALPCMTVPKLKIPNCRTRDAKYKWCDQHAGSVVTLEEVESDDVDWMTYADDQNEFDIAGWLGRKYVPNSGRHFYAAYVRGWVARVC
jgi:hypothetical protein